MLNLTMTLPRLARVLLAILLIWPLAAAADQLTLERIFTGGSLDGPTMRSLTISPDGQRVSFLRARDDDQSRLDLWEYHIADAQLRLLVDADRIDPDGGQEASALEQARRERARTAGLGGIVNYSWSPDGEKLLFPLGDALYLLDLKADGADALRKLPTGGAVIDPQVSPRGGFVSWVREQNLWAMDLASGQLRQLTHDGGGTVHNGEAEFVAQEEMDRSSGYWWAPDDSLIAFERFDEARVPLVRRFETHADDVQVVEQRYPAAGDANVVVTLGVVSPLGDAARWIDLGEDEDIYLVRVNWLPDAQQLSWQQMARNQQHLALSVAQVTRTDDVGEGDERKGEGGDEERASGIDADADVPPAEGVLQRTVLSEASATWINLHKDLRFVEEGQALIWASERSGFKQLYLYDIDGTLRHAISAGDWDIDAVLAVDEDAGLVYAASNRSAVPERHVWVFRLDGSSAKSPQRVTMAAGTHHAVFSPDAVFFVDTWSDPTTPPQVSLRKADGGFLAWIEPNPLDDSHPYAPYRDDFIAPRFGTLQAVDGQTLYYRLYLPTDFDPKQRYPVLSSFYGGPTVQRVVSAWGDHFHQYMAQQGFVVFTLDNRGTSGRGRAFSDPVYRQLGDVEVIDQLSGIDWLKEQPWVDGQRVGVFGWSYGGYLAAMLLAKASDEVAAGVAVAPVTDWSLYDTFYTERYLARPQDNRAGYLRSGVLAWVDGLHSSLLLIHGMADDNVLFSNSTKLMAALQEAGTPFELMTYPGGKHGMSTPAMRVHTYGSIARFLQRELRPCATPAAKACVSAAVTAAQEQADVSELESGSEKTELQETGSDSTFE